MTAIKRQFASAIIVNNHDLAVTTDIESAAIEFGASDASRPARFIRTRRLLLYGLRIPLQQGNVVPLTSRRTRPGTDEPSAHPWHQNSDSCCTKGRHFEVKYSYDGSRLVLLLAHRAYPRKLEKMTSGASQRAVFGSVGRRFQSCLGAPKKTKGHIVSRLALFSFFGNTVYTLTLQPRAETHIVRFAQRSPTITGFPPIDERGFSDERAAHG